MDRVFISHSSKDAAAARALVDYLERQSIGCWIAPRDMPGGSVWAGAIYDAIQSAKATVVLCSPHSIASDQVLRELELSAARKLLVVPVRLSDIALSGAFSYFLSSTHWIDLFPGAIETRLALVGAALGGTTIEIPVTLPTPVDLLPPDQWSRPARKGLMHRLMSMLDDKE